MSKVTSESVQYAVIMKTSLIFCLLLTALIYSGSAQYDNRTELRVAFITSFGGEYDSSIAAPAVRLAANNVNENESILPGYRLVVELVDDRTTARRYANSKVYGS